MIIFKMKIKHWAVKKYNDYVYHFANNFVNHFGLKVKVKQNTKQQLAMIYVTQSTKCYFYH